MINLFKLIKYSYQLRKIWKEWNKPGCVVIDDEIFARYEDKEHELLGVIIKGANK